MKIYHKNNIYLLLEKVFWSPRYFDTLTDLKHIKFNTKEDTMRKLIKLTQEIKRR